MSRFVYILTDYNRKSLHVGISDNLQETIAYYKRLQQSSLDPISVPSRLVYFEEITNENIADHRFQLLSLYTRPQKERLIRAKNTNWQDLTSCLDMLFSIDHQLPFISSRSISA